MRLGLDLSRHHAAAILADANAASVCALRAPLPIEGGTPAIWAATMETARETLRRASVSSAQVESVALAFDAIVANGVVLKGRNTDGWHGFDLVRALNEHLEIADARAENRVVCQARGEARYGALRTDVSRTDETWLYVEVGAGLGAAMGSGETLWRGARGAFLDIGGICIDRDGGLGLGGRRGTLDAYCSGDGFHSRAASYGITQKSAREVWESAPQNFAARSLCDDFVKRLAQGIGSACSLLAPQRIVLGGALAGELGEVLLAPLRTALGEFCAPPLPQVIAAQLGDDAAVLGAVVLAAKSTPE